MSGFDKIAASSAPTTAIPGALFDLTPSEARVGSAIATRYAVSLATVRTL